MYVCGPTVQSEPHIGHLRSAVVYDLWARWFRASGYTVTLVRNVTDIDDKILEKSAQSGEPWWALGQRVEREFHRATDRLGIERATLEPRATGDIPHMVALIQRLIERGHAYVADDGSGDVYFDVASWPDYGQLTRQKPDDMVSGESSESAKRSPHDFALWKGHKASEPETASWPTPWGGGRPGWHIECSAMATRYLGRAFDIHGGGMDLRFPHHENELAQSLAAGDSFAQVWLHNALVTISGQKMSKSLGNSVFADDILREHRPIVVRYALTQAHYRSDVELGEGALADAEAAWRRIEGFLERSPESESRAALPAEFAAAMDNDLSTPQAFAVLHDRVRRGNQALDEGDTESARLCRAEVLAMLDVLGMNPEVAPWNGDVSAARDDLVDAVVGAVISSRQRAREKKNFALSDELRDVLAEAGITVEDTASGPVWRTHG